jgi:hypothetical protein
VRALVEAIVLPFVRMLASDAQQGAYVAFLARVVGEADVSLEQFAPPTFWRMIERLLRLLQRALPHVPPRVLLLRARFVLQQTFVLVTDVQRLERRGGTPQSPADLEIVGADFVDYLVGALSAPSRAAEAAPRSAPRPAAQRTRRQRGGRPATTRGSARRTRR